MLRTARNLAAGSLCFLSLAAPAIAADPIGTVVASAGSPKASGPGGSRELSAGSPIYEDDRLSTGGGNVQIMFIDRTKLLVGPGSTLVIERFLLRGGNSVRKFSIDALRGTFRFISGNSAKNAYDIKTANATIGIRGTGFDFSSGGATLVAVHAGRVQICAYGQCESVDDRCGVGRAANNSVDELGGKAKGRAIRSLPYILNQGPLAQPFRLNTSSCRSVATLFQNFFGGGSQGGNDGQEGGPRGSPPDSGGYGGGSD
jgi:hypothetical protein